MNTPFDTISEAFSRTAAHYDAFADHHPNLTRTRNKVYTHLARHLPPAARILEINAGTGTDASELARSGFSVHATDIADGMLARAEQKALDPALGGRMTVQKCSFTTLNQAAGGPYDALFSNLGGLNCIPDLSPVIRQIPAVLKPGGVVTWVLMPPVCLWELAEIFRGHPRLAFRRLARQGTLTHLEALYFNVYYFSPGKVQEWFGPRFEFLALEGLSVITPTAESKNLAIRHPRFYRLLAWLDDRLAPLPLWNSLGDFFILSMRYKV